MSDLIQQTKQQVEPTTLLASGATYNGHSDDTENENLGYDAFGYSKFRALVYSDQGGTLNIQQSRDGATWRTTKTVAYLAAAATTLEDIVIRQHVRVQVVNGGTDQTEFELDTALIAV